MLSWTIGNWIENSQKLKYDWLTSMNNTWKQNWSIEISAQLVYNYFFTKNLCKISTANSAPEKGQVTKFYNE